MMIEKEIITKDELLELRDSFTKLFREGCNTLKEMSIKDENFNKISGSTLYCLENIFGIDNEVNRVDKLRAEKNTGSPTE